MVSNLENFWYLVAKKDLGWNPLSPKVFNSAANAAGYLGNAISRRNVNNVPPEDPAKKRELASKLARTPSRLNINSLEITEEQKNTFLNDLYDTDNSESQNKPVPENIKMYLKTKIQKYSAIIKEDFKNYIGILLEKADTKIINLSPVRNEINSMFSIA